MLHCAGMRLAPGVFMRGNVLRFGKIGRARILRWIQVAGLHQDSVRRASVVVAGVVVGTSTEKNP